MSFLSTWPRLRGRSALFKHRNRSNQHIVLISIPLYVPSYPVMFVPILIFIFPCTSKSRSNYFSILICLPQIPRDIFLGPVKNLRFDVGEPFGVRLHSHRSGRWLSGAEPYHWWRLHHGGETGLRHRWRETWKICVRHGEKHGKMVEHHRKMW